jgi:hypothetical protein
MIRADDDAALRHLIMTMARYAGTTIDEATAAHLTPAATWLLGCWPALTRATVREVEPMSVGRWPEDSHEVE